MIDNQRRNALKLVGGTGIGLAISTTPALAALSSLNGSSFPPTSRGSVELDMTIVSTSAVPEDTLVLQNNTDAPLIIESFKPGTIVFGEKLVNLSSTTNEQPLVVKPGIPLSMPVKVYPLLAAPQITEYVWADDAVSTISDTATAVHLGAFFVENNAVVYPLKHPVLAA